MHKTVDAWISEIRRLVQDLDTHETKVFDRIMVFEATDLWAKKDGGKWNGRFDSYISAECGVDVNRYRGFAEAVRYLGHDAALTMGVTAAVVVWLDRIPETHVVAAYKALSRQVAGFQTLHRHLPAESTIKDKLKKIRSDLHVPKRPGRPAVSQLQRALGAIEEMTRMTDVKKIHQLCHETLAALGKEAA
jgi:hypothetical protein